MAKTRECCSALSLRRTGDDLHVSLYKGFEIWLAGIVPVSSPVHWKDQRDSKMAPNIRMSVRVSVRITLLIDLSQHRISYFSPMSPFVYSISSLSTWRPS